VEVLNAYLASAPMPCWNTKVLDKFVGDAVMGLFNVPLDQTLYAARGESSLEDAGRH
jgi:hypothetical protein